jgi:hypothetical protein
MICHCCHWVEVEAQVEAKMDAQMDAQMEAMVEARVGAEVEAQVGARGEAQVEVVTPVVTQAITLQENQVELERSSPGGSNSPLPNNPPSVHSSSITNSMMMDEHARTWLRRIKLLTEEQLLTEIEASTLRLELMRCRLAYDTQVF